MDADFMEKRRQRISQREKRWSMNSQRLEQIVMELMKPITDLRRSFDMDHSALLEAYLTEVGIHALDEEGGDEVPAEGAVVINFTELALVLQQSACAYGRKVDYLHTHVLEVATSLHDNTEIANTSNDGVEEGAPAGGRRRRGPEPAVEGFGSISLQSAAGARREPGCARPPPTLPRAYIGLAPAPAPPHSHPLQDYSGAPVGLLRDYQCCWALRGGLLADELVHHVAATPLRAIPLVELQQAIEARAPPPPPPLACSSPVPPPPAGSPPASPAPPADLPPPAAPLAHKERKRKNDNTHHGMDHDVSVKLHITADTLTLLRGDAREFSISSSLRSLIISRRSLAVVTLRRQLRLQRTAALHGFDTCHQDTTGFPGWSLAEAQSATTRALTASTAVSNAATAAAATATNGARRDESDDDGFFEQSSLGDSDLSVSQLSASCYAEADDWASWQARVVRRANEAEAAGGVDVAALASTVLGALPDPAESSGDPANPAPHKQLTQLLRETATQHTDVSRLFLATLFLANSGNVEIIPGAPLSVNTFSLRVLSRDTARYSDAAQELFAVPAPPAPATPDTAPQPPRKRARRPDR